MKLRALLRNDSSLLIVRGVAAGAAPAPAVVFEMAVAERAGSAAMVAAAPAAASSSVRSLASGEAEPAEATEAFCLLSLDVFLLESERFALRGGGESRVVGDHCHVSKTDKGGFQQNGTKGCSG